MDLDKPLRILATIPRSGTWFIRYAIAFLHHLEQGGRVHDRITGRVVGVATGPEFDFRHFLGGPIFETRATLPFERLFIGHTVCPGFSRVADKPGWWNRTSFHVPGYDYFHDGLDYRYKP